MKSGALGPICKIETAWNRNVPSWRRPVDMVKEADVDWEQYQMYHPKQPFDPVRYRCWHWYYEYTTGLVGLLGSHMIDVALWFMNDPFPASAVALGDILTWKDGRQISDTAEYVFEFPKGWLLTFSSRLGSGPESDYEIFYGQERTLDTRDWISRPAANRRPDDATDTALPSCTTSARARARRQLARLHALAADAERTDPGRLRARRRLLPRPRGRTHRPEDAGPPATRRIVEAADTRPAPLGEPLSGQTAPGPHASGHQSDLLGRTSSALVPQSSSAQHDDSARGVLAGDAQLHADADLDQRSSARVAASGSVSERAMRAAGVEFAVAS